jgi:hypothetical protein
VVEASADLRDAVLRELRLGIDKPAGVPGTAEARFTLAGGRIASVRDAALRFGATDVRGRAEYDRAGMVRTLDLAGTLGPVPGRATPARVTVNVASDTALRSLVATADTADLLFRAIGFDAGASGGRLRFEGVVPPGPALVIDGRVVASDFRLTRAPVLTRLLATASLSGLASTLTGSGLAVTQFAARVRHAAAVVTLDDGVLESPAFGMRFAGTAGGEGGAVDFRGSLVPSYYGLNTLAARVPVLGRVITGVKKQGLQVFEFTVRGTTAAPKIAVDPVSSLAPGAVRDLLKLLPRPTLPARRR